jgi:hypothetical protein
MIQTDIPLILEREFGLPEYESAVAVGFALMPVEDKTETRKRGRPYYKDVEFVKIVTPGDKNAVYLQPASDKHRQRFPKAYSAFKSGQVVAVDGTPLEHWPIVTRSQALNFRAYGVHTVEALATLHDGNLENFGREARELREKARGYLKQAEDTAAVQKLAAEKQDIADQLAAVQAQMAAMQARFEAAMAAKAEQPAAAPRAARRTTVEAATP